MSEREHIAALIADGAAAIDVALDDAAVGRLVGFVEQLERWRHRINLVGPGTLDELVERHVIDSLGLLRLLDDPQVTERVSRWTDVGSGSGAPGLLCALARPALHWTLLEPIGKRVSFMESVLRAGGAPNCRVLQGRLEDLEPQSCPGLVSRATFAPEVWAQEGRAYAAPGGLLIVTMGADGLEAIIDGAWRVDRFSLPVSSARRVNAAIAC